MQTADVIMFLFSSQSVQAQANYPCLEQKLQKRKKILFET